MAKRFKLKLSRAMPSFQICRSKTSSDTNPIPAIYRISPFSRKSHDINYPRFPDPPPSTPDCPSTKPHGNRRSPRSLAYYLADFSIESPDFAWKKDEHRMRLQPRNRQRFMQSVSFSDESIENISPVIVTENKKNEIETDDVGCCFSNQADDEDENELETESLLFSSRSFSYDSSFDFCNLPAAAETITKNSVDNGNSETTSKKNIRKLRRQLSKKSSGKSSSAEISSPVRASVLRRMMSCTTTDGKVKESMAVVKKSENPYEDFKRSMLEMILEKQMFEARDLEELLHCFLSLNSRQYHGVIIEAFSEIWKILFCDSPVKKPSSMRVRRLRV
ncbi:hypothetical protein JCGZ_04412 [Jatropha curcas]|uniref:Transcription repressor n=1 Tax=Jatropha curcas TaxID=180498 RepID=A0A067KQS2_JATCU|nr:transcription repressor OFP7 [Jatropha curcas]KDP38487.1 hypothetical protein JCGZ_04412 [Jatropha curcas]